ncbi:MAG: folylpolyglutamate synthase/dihydrofolate synthase family protein [Planctomycetota bacterium]
MTYTEALAYLNSFTNLERSLNRATRLAITLDRVRELASRLGHPERRFRSLHVAGTKGKGSTCAFAAAILTAAGLKVGRYTSPHLQSVRERICINGAQIPKKDFARLLAACSLVLEQMRHPPPGQRRPTYFEVLTHLAFTWFAEQRVDVAVIEVGLGGQLDATNIITPMACGVTNISFDHMAILGDTLSQIARDKAGIMKSGVPVVIAPQAPEVAAILEDCARVVGAPVEFVGREIKLESVPLGDYLRRPARSVKFRDEDWPLPRAKVTLPDGAQFDATLGLRGLHQTQNWAVAVRLADLCYTQLQSKRLPVTAVRQGSRRIRWPGRLEEIASPQADESAAPRIFLDGAHNDFSLRTILNEVREHLPRRQPLVVLFACAKDKDSRAMLDVLRQVEVGAVVFTHSGNSRGKEPSKLAREWQMIDHCKAYIKPSCMDGFETAVRLAGANGVVVVAGSLYLVGAIKDLLTKTIKTRNFGNRSPQPQSTQR